jgi:AcrR family transcriptional regulator
VVSKLRARNPEDKQARWGSILTATLEMWQETAYPNFTMHALAARLGLAKGTLYLYFPTKEALFLTLFERLLGDWLDYLEEELSQGSWKARKLAGLIAQSLAQRPPLARLFPLLESILEHNITPAKARAYKTWLLHRAAPIAALLEQHLGLKRGMGIKVLAYTQALIAGIQQMTDASPIVLEVLQEAPLHLLKLEFESDLQAALTALFSGVQNR